MAAREANSWLPVVCAAGTAFVTINYVVRVYVFPFIGRKLRGYLQQHSYAKFMSLREELCLDDPRATTSPNQTKNNQYLLTVLRKNENTELGRELSFHSIENAEQDREIVPLCSYCDILSKIERLCQGEQYLMSTEKLFYFGTSSGTTGKQKMIA